MRLPKGATVTEQDREELTKFEAWIKLEASRRAGGEPAVLNTLEQALYPEGIGREPIDGPVEA